MDDLRPVILGYDMVSPLGTDLETQWDNVLAGKSGIGPLTRFPLRPGFPVTAAGQVEELDVAPYPFLSPRQLALWPSPLFKYSLLVIHRALKNAGLEITPDVAPDVAVTFSPAVGGLDAVLGADRALQAQGRMPKPWVNPNSCINMVGGKAAILTGAAGPNITTVAACATGSASLIVGALLIASGMARAVICGGVDFPLVEPIVAGFATMNGAYRAADPEELPGRASRPFSLDRRGFVVSEGAACLILASREFAATHGLPHGIELAGWGMTADAHHFVAPHPPTVALCLKKALEHAGIGPGDLQAVNAHAASTKIGDQVEAEALAQVLGRIPPVYAGKSQFGHAMGAASAIELILAAKGMLTASLPPTINYTPDPALPPLDVSAAARVGVPQEHVLKNAFGFGGTNACIVLRRTA
ncbi:MAG: beta-ketoacyl-[acyl-carrier-protein] synthase family protein [Pseudomonadota bacterium]